MIVEPTDGRHLTLVVDAGADVSTTTGPAGGNRESEPSVAAEVAAVLAGATDEVLAVAPLTLPLALSLCMERNDAGAEGLISVMQSLRRAVLAVSGLDPRSEPVPLVAGDRRTAALGLAEYLRGLLARVACSSAAAPLDVAAAAAAHLA